MSVEMVSAHRRRGRGFRCIAHLRRLTESELSRYDPLSRERRTGSVVFGSASPCPLLYATLFGWLVLVFVLGCDTG